jgi:hypothetical protein
MRLSTDAGMGTNVAAAWQKVAKLLQDCSTKQPGSAEAALSSIKQLLGKLPTLPPAPKAVWKKLVQQQKVSEDNVVNVNVNILDVSGIATMLRRCAIATLACDICAWSRSSQRVVRTGLGQDEQ